MKKILLLFVFICLFQNSSNSQSWMIVTDSLKIKYEKNIVLQRNHLVYSVKALRDTQNIDLSKVKEIIKLGSFFKGFFWGTAIGAGATFYLIGSSEKADKIIELAGGTPPTNDLEREDLKKNYADIGKYSLVGGLPLGIIAGLLTMQDTKYNLSNLTIEHKKEVVTKLLGR